MVHIKRHFLKTITYRIISSIASFFIGYVVTGSALIGFSFSIIELVIKPIIYFLHERFWYKYVKFGINHKNVD